jgi:hypothetical protein
MTGALSQLGVFQVLFRLVIGAKKIHCRPVFASHLKPRSVKRRIFDDQMLNQTYEQRRTTFGMLM